MEAKLTAFINLLWSTIDLYEQEAILYNDAVEASIIKEASVKTFFEYHEKILTSLLVQGQSLLDCFLLQDTLQKTSLEKAIDALKSILVSMEEGPIIFRRCN